MRARGDPGADAAGLHHAVAEERTARPAGRYRRDLRSGRRIRDVARDGRPRRIHLAAIRLRAGTARRHPRPRRHRRVRRRRVGRPHAGRRRGLDRHLRFARRNLAGGRRSTRGRCERRGRRPAAGIRPHRYRHRWSRLPARLRWHRPGRRIPEDPAAQRRLVPDRPVRLRCRRWHRRRVHPHLRVRKHRIDLLAGRGIHGPRYRRPCTPVGRTPEGLRRQRVHHRCDGHDVPRNPLAGIATTSAWLPSGLGTFGQILPPGAAGTLVRSAAYFDGAGGFVALSTLAAWIVVGLVLYVVGMRRAVGEEATERPSAQVAA